MNENIETMNTNTENSQNMISLSDIMATEEKKEPSGEVIGLDRLFDEDEEEVIDAYEDDLQKEELRQKRITKIQIGLIIFLAVFGTLVYFFGYDIFEPYIKID